MTRYALLEQFPVTGTEETSAGRLPVPYHVYDGHGTLIGGTADLANVTKLLESENLQPIATESGRALMGIWVVDFTEAGLGPHNELQFSILVAHERAKPVADHPLALLKSLFVNPAARMFSYRLWNNSETAVAYNRELLGLNAQPTVGTIVRDEGHKTFHFIDDEGQMLCEGDVIELERPTPQVNWSLIRHFGLRSSLRAMRQPYLEAKVVNPSGELFAENLDAQTYLAADSPVVQFFAETADTLTLGDPYAGLFDFQPQFIEHFAPFRFVYLQPQPSS